MTPRSAVRFHGYAGFDLKLIGVDGATKFMDMVAKDPKEFQNIRSLYLGVVVEGLDEFTDDMLAFALNMLSPGNVSHNLENVKIFIAGVDYMEMHATSVCSPSASRDAPLQSMLFDLDPPESLLESKGVVYYKAERAFIKALLNIRGVKRVEVEGPMPAELKIRIGACMTTRPGCKVRSWKGEQSSLRTDMEISVGTWMATMQSRDDPIDDTVGPDGVERGDTTAIHHGPELFFTVEQPVPESPPPEEDRTIWNKPPFRYSSPEPGHGTNITAASIRFVEKPEDPPSSSPPNRPDAKDEDSKPKTRSRKRRTTMRTPTPEPPLKRRSTRSTTRLSLSNAALDAYDAKKAIGFPPSPPGRLRRVNYTAPDIEEDFGTGDDTDPSRRMSWFRGDRQLRQKQWVLPTGKGAKISVARKVDREGRRQMREKRKRESALEGDSDEDYEELSDSEDEDEPKKREGPSRVNKEIADSEAEEEDGEEAQEADVDVDMDEDEDEYEQQPSSSSSVVNDEDDDNYDDEDEYEQQPRSSSFVVDDEDDDNYDDEDEDGYEQQPRSSSFVVDDEDEEL